MKSILALVLFTALQISTSFGAKPINARLQKVNVYLQGAHLYYSEPIFLQAGNNEFIFENISPYIQAATLQANSKGGLVMETRHQVKYREKKQVANLYDKPIALVLDSMEENSYDLQAVENHLSVLAQEKKMLLGNRLIRGDSQKDSLPILRESMAFTREKLNEILEEELKWNKRKNKLSKETTRLNNRYNQLILLQNGTLEENGIQAAPIDQVIISIYSEAGGNAQISFNYFVQQASWIPNYDLVASSATNQIELKSFAHVYQSSGINWKNAALTLSTSNPMERNIKPVLANWYIGFQEYRKYKALKAASMNSAMPMSKVTVTDNYKESNMDQKMADDEILSEYINITENLIRTEYEIKLKYEIESDNKAHKVMIKEQTIPMILAFAAVPKICQDAFLMGRVTGWEDLNILPGAARIYFDGAYVGETFVSNQSTNDTLDFNLGKDKSIVMTRKKVKEKTKVRNIENERIETRSIELVIRNTKGISVLMNLEDQIPVSQNPNEIKVTLIDGDGANLDELTGSLKWNLKLGAKESKKITFTYEIRYPKNKQVFGL